MSNLTTSARTNRGHWPRARHQRPDNHAPPNPSSRASGTPESERSRRQERTKFHPIYCALEQSSRNFQRPAAAPPMLARRTTGSGLARPLFNFALSMAVYACYFRDLGPGWRLSRDRRAFI